VTLAQIITEESKQPRTGDHSSVSV